jgi:hypothetical protein
MLLQRRGYERSTSSKIVHHVIGPNSFNDFREALTTTLSIDNFKFTIHILAEVILV